MLQDVTEAVSSAPLFHASHQLLGQAILATLYECDWLYGGGGIPRNNGPDKVD